MPHRIEAWQAAYRQSFVDHLIRVAADTSLRLIRYDEDLPSYSRVKQVALHEERTHAQAGGHSDAQLLKFAEQELAEKDREIHQVYRALFDEETRTKEARLEAQEAKTQWYLLQKRIT